MIIIPIFLIYNLSLPLQISFYIFKNPIMNIELQDIDYDVNKFTDLIALQAHSTSFN
jgi:hypothetical protein